MAKDIQKPNDMLVSTLVNGNVSTMDLLQNGINAGNTQFLDPESYKESPLVKKQFTDQEGNFREDLFNQAYLAAAKQYEDLANMNTYKKLEDYVEYNAKDIFAPLTSKKADTSYEISPEINPQRRSHGVSSLFEYGDSKYSMRELAQMSKIWDSEKGEWMDKTAEDRGVLGSLFGESLVYATYDEDTDEIDPVTGRKVHHQKGEWKLNDKGQYYTETIGNRSGYGKQFVAASDTLTKEGSALNKIDFFDSDDLDKSTAGIVMKTVAKIAPYMIPVVNEFWGATTAALAMAKALPTFAKMIEGIAIGGDADNETGLTKRLNQLENYFGKFNGSYSDTGMESNWGAEKMLDQVADIFAQLYQFRAAASLSKLAVLDPTKKIAAELGEKYSDDIARSMAASLPEVQEAIKAQSKLSKAFSMGYMALTSSADVYAEALDGGYDRRMAGAAGLAATLGQYGIMMSEETLNLGGWFLDSKVGYHNAELRKTIMKAVRENWKEIEEAVKKMEGATTKAEKAGILQKVLTKISPFIKEARLGLGEGAQYLKNGVTEALEEVTEEAVMDATKGIFDFLSWAGMGKNAGNASFGVVDDFASGNFLERYAQNAVGGLMGGVLFEFQQNRIEPFIQQKVLGKMPVEDKVSLIHEIANGNTQQILKAIDEMAALDSDIAAIPIDINGNKVIQSAGNGQMTRGQMIGNILKNHVRQLEGALVTEGLNLSDEKLKEKALRDYQVINILEEKGFDKLLIDDFTRLSTEIATLQDAIKNAEEDEKSSLEGKSKEEQAKITKEAETKAKEEIKTFDPESKYDGRSSAFLKELLAIKRKEASQFLDGKKAGEYLRLTLLGTNDKILNALGALNLYEYTYMKYGKQFSELPQKSNTSLSQEQVKVEHEKWKAIEDPTKKFLKFGAKAFDKFEELVVKPILEYAKSGYGDVRKISINGRVDENGKPINSPLYADGNLTIDMYTDSEVGFEHLKELVNSLKEQSKNSADNSDGTIGILFNQDPELLKDQIQTIIRNNPRLTQILNLLGVDEKKLEKQMITDLSTDLLTISVSALNGESLTKLVNGYLWDLIEDNIKEGKDGKQKFVTLQELANFLAANSSLYGEYNPEIGQSASINDQIQFIEDNIALDTHDVSVGLATSLLGKYLTSEQVIDGEVRKQLAYQALDAITRRLSFNAGKLSQEFNDMAVILEDLDTGEQEWFKIPSGKITKLINLFRQKFDQHNVSIDDIINEWGEGLINDWLTSLGDLDNYGHAMTSGVTKEEILNGTLLKTISDKIKEVFVNDPIVKLYTDFNADTTKVIKDNPILDMIDKVDMVWTKGGGQTITKVSRANSGHLRDVEQLQDFVAEGEQKDQIDSARSSLQLVSAVLEAMRDGDMEFGNPFAINQQMKRFYEHNHLEADRDYETIDYQTSFLINYDLGTVDKRFLSYLNIAERAHVATAAMDSRNKKKYAELMLQMILEKANALSFKNISLLPSEEREKKFETPEAALAHYASVIYSNFRKIKSAEGRRDALKELITNLNLALDKIDRSSKPQNLNQELKSIETLDFLTWLVTALSADQKQFFHTYNQAILQDKKNGVVPFFAQELALQQAWAFKMDKNDILDDNNNNVSVHDFFLQEIFKLKGDTIPSLPMGRMFFVNGIGGAGKTAVIAGSLLKFFPDNLVQIIAPNEQQVKNYSNAVKKYCSKEQAASLKESHALETLKMFFGDNYTKIVDNIKTITKVESFKQYFDSKPTDSVFKKKEAVTPSGEGFTLAELNVEKIEKLLVKDIDLSTIPEMFLIDEVTQISPLTLQIFNFLSKKYNIKMFAFGDNTQRGARLSQDTQGFNDLFPWRSPKLNISVRSNNKQIAKNAYACSRSIEEYDRLNALHPGKEAQDLFRTHLVNNPVTVSYYEDDHTLNGYKFVQTLYDKDAQDTITTIRNCNREANKKKDNPKKKIMVITEVDNLGKPVEGNNITEILKQAEIDINDEVEFFSYKDIHDKAVQGSESRYVIVDDKCIENDPNAEPGEAFRAIYTFASRASDGVLMVVPMDTQRALNIINAQDRTTQVDSVPQLEEVEKLKDTRIEEVGKILKGYKPAKTDTPVMQSEKRNKKTVYVRSDYDLKQKKAVAAAKGTEEVKKEAKEKAEADAELNSFDEETQAKIERAENSELKPLEEEHLVIASSSKEKTFTKAADDKAKVQTSVQVIPAIDHLGLERRKTKDGWVRDNNHTSLDLDGLFARDREKVSETVVQGFVRFKNAIIAALETCSAENEEEYAEYVKEAIRKAIKNDSYIALFLAETYSELASQIPTSIEKEWNTQAFRDVYAKWFEDEMVIDPHYYIFAKKMKWSQDQPVSIRGNKDEAISDGKPVLFYGIHMWSKNADNTPNGTFNQYISLGAMSKPTYFNAEEGREMPINSVELKDLYVRAEKDLSTRKFIAYELPKSNLHGLDMTSTMWIKKAPLEADDSKRFESVKDMLKRGFNIDKDNIFLVDDSRVTLDDHGTQVDTYTAIAILAAVGETSADINKYFDGKQLSFAERVKKLEAAFAPDGGPLNITGHYISISSFVNPAVTKSSVFRRVLFLDPRQSEAKEVLDDLMSVSPSRENWKAQLRYCRPSSQKDLLITMLQQGKAFENTGTLLKYLIGTRDYLMHKSNGESYLTDKKMLQKLIDLVHDKQQEHHRVSQEEFRTMIGDLNFRTILLPFVRRFLVKEEDYGSIVLKLKNVIPYDYDYDEGTITEHSAKGEKAYYTLQFEAVDETGKVFKPFSKSYACPLLTKSSDQIDVLKAFKGELPEGVTVLAGNMDLVQVSDTTDLDSLGMYGYELQAPRFQMQNTWMAKDDIVPHDEELYHDYKYDTTRSATIHIVDRPADYKPDAYLPETMLKEAYVDAKNKKSDPEFLKKHAGVAKREKKEVVETYWDAKEHRRKAKKNPKNGSDKKKIEEIITYSGEIGQRFDHSEDGNSKGLFFTVSVNSRGFEIRPGDYVQLYNDPNYTYYVERIDMKGIEGEPQIMITRYGLPSDLWADMQDVRKGGLAMPIPADAVTKMVRRTVSTPESINRDYYRDAKNFTYGDKFAAMGRIKSWDQFQEMLDATKDPLAFVQALNFNDLFYYIKPITAKEYNSINGRRELYVPNGVKAEDAVQNREELLTRVEEIKDNPDYVGFVMYNVGINQLSNVEHIQNMIDTIKGKDNEDRPENRSIKKMSKYIANIVYKDPSVAASESVDSEALNIDVVDYNPTRIARDLVKPAEKIIFRKDDGRLDLHAINQHNKPVKSFTRTKFDVIWGSKSESTFPHMYWMYRERRDLDGHEWCDMYPRAEFFFGQPKRDVSQQPWTRDLKKQYVDFCNIGGTEGENLILWKRLLRNYQVRDYQWQAYLPDEETKNSDSKTEKKRKHDSNTEKFNGKMRLNKNDDGDSTFTITDVFYMNAPEGAVKTPAYLYVSMTRKGVTERVPLIELLATMGSRFEFVEAYPETTVPTEKTETTEDEVITYDTTSTTNPTENIAEEPVVEEPVVEEANEKSPIEEKTESTTPIEEKQEEPQGSDLDRPVSSSEVTLNFIKEIKSNIPGLKAGPIVNITKKIIDNYEQLSLTNGNTDNPKLSLGSILEIVRTLSGIANIANLKIISDTVKPINGSNASKQIFYAIASNPALLADPKFINVINNNVSKIKNNSPEIPAVVDYVRDNYHIDLSKITTC